MLRKYLSSSMSEITNAGNQNFSKAELEWLKQWGLEGKITFRDFQIALTHGSLKNVDPNAVTYQRFEFLGDAVLSLITAEQHFTSPGELNEGIMTQLRSNEVRYKTLERIFDLLELKEFIRTGHTEQSFNVRGDFVESIFGALFIHQGYETCRDFWLKIQKKLDQITSSSDISPKLCSEVAASEKSIGAFLNENLSPKGSNSIPLDDVKKAALATFLQKFIDNKIPLKAPIIMLQEFCQANHVPLPEYIEIERKEIHCLPNSGFNFIFKVVSNPFNMTDNESFMGVGQGRSKQQAKMSAAANLCDQIHLPYASDTIL